MIKHDIDITILASRIHLEILEDMQDGTLPLCIPNFSALHNYVDANMYGDAEEICERIGLSKTIDVLNAAQVLVNQRLARSGGYPLLPGWAWQHTGGGCTALVKPLGDASNPHNGACWMITASHNEGMAPERWTETVDLGKYNEDGDQVAFWTGIPYVGAALYITEDETAGAPYVYQLRHQAN